MQRIHRGFRPFFSPRHSTSARLLLPALCLIMLVTGLAGCARLRKGKGKEEAKPEPADYVKVTAAGAAKGAPTAPAGEFGASLTEPLRAEGKATLDAQIPDPSERVLMARAEARRAALRALARAAVAIQGKSGQRVAEALKAAPDKKNALTQALETQSQVTYREQGNESLATAVIEGRQIAAALDPAAAAQAASQAALTPQQLTERKEAALEAATDTAKQKLREELLAIKMDNGKTVGQALAEDPSATRELEALLFIAQPDEIKWRDDGSCEVTIYFDRNRVLALAGRPKRRWLPW